MGELERFAETEELQRTVSNLQRELHRANQRNLRLVDEVYRAASNAAVMAAMRKPVSAPKRDERRAKPEVALWHLTDWQGGKETATYNSTVMRDRVQQFCRRAVRITEVQRADHPVRDCVIAFGGDLLEGVSIFPRQPWEVDSTLFEQIFCVADAVIDVVRHVLANYEKVTVVAEWGNHGRVGSKRDAIPKSDNLDRVCYETARRTLADQPRLTWQSSEEDIQRIEIGNYRALLIHGDEIGRLGFASPMTITQHVNRWKSGAYPWQFRDCLVGHYHTHMQTSTADGEGAVFWTGSTESDNRYARETMAASAKPSQRLHFIQPDVGRVTACYQIWLD